MGCWSPGWAGRTARTPRHWPSGCLPTATHGSPMLALVLQSCCCGQARLPGLCPYPSSSWPMAAGVPWGQNRILGPLVPWGPSPAGTGRESEVLEEVQQPCYSGFQPWARGHRGVIEQGGSRGTPEEGAQGSSKEEETGQNWGLQWSRGEPDRVSPPDVKAGKEPWEPHFRTGEFLNGAPSLHPPSEGGAGVRH